MPPYLAGREDETKEFQRLLRQDTILENLVLTGLRGIGKTVLLETFKPLAIQEKWLWAGTDLSESISISEEHLAIRLLTDLSVVTSSIVVSETERTKIGFGAETDKLRITLNYDTLLSIYQNTPGLVSDKLKTVLEFSWPILKMRGNRGIIFAYDEAQNLSDHAAKDQYPLSLLLDIFQSIQRKDIPFMLALTGLPTLFPKLVAARTFAERMFHLIFLDPLNEKDTWSAITNPIEDAKCPLAISDASIQEIWRATKGYPYFIQFVCREIYDVWIQSREKGEDPGELPISEILRKLDTDFFSGRWSRASDRQRDLLWIVSQLDHHDQEFTVQEVVESAANKSSAKPFSSSHVNQMFTKLSAAGLIYKNRHGKYSFAVPLLGDFIRRQRDSD